LANAQAVIAAKRKPELLERMKRLLKLELFARQGGNLAVAQQLQRKIKEADAQLRLSESAPRVLAGVVYHYWHSGLNSVETAHALGIQPPHVRKLLWQLGKVAGELGYGPVKTVKRRPPTLERKKQSRAVRKERTKAQAFAKLLHEGLTWIDAKKKFGDTSVNHHYWRKLCQKHGVTLPPRAAGSRPRSEQYQFQHCKEVASLRAQGMSYPAIAKRYGTSIRVLRRALKKAGLYVGRNKNTKFDVAEAQRLRAEGKTYRQIGQHLGVSATAAWVALRPSGA
jgi:transposase